MDLNAVLTSLSLISLIFMMGLAFKKNESPKSQPVKERVKPRQRVQR